MNPDNLPHAIYSITNKISGKRYIGMTRSPETREYNHFMGLRRGYHHNPRLQEAFTEFGEASFQWEILETVSDKSSALQRERFWIRHFDSFHNGYNGSDGLESRTKFLKLKYETTKGER